MRGRNISGVGRSCFIGWLCCVPCVSPSPVFCLENNVAFLIAFIRIFHEPVNLRRGPTDRHGALQVYLAHYFIAIFACLKHKCPRIPPTNAPLRAAHRQQTVVGPRNRNHIGRRGVRRACSSTAIPGLCGGGPERRHPLQQLREGGARPTATEVDISHQQRPDGEGKEIIR